MALKDQYFSIFITRWSLQRAVVALPGVKNERTNNDSGSSLNENSETLCSENDDGGVGGVGGDKLRIVVGRQTAITATPRVCQIVR